MNNLLADVNISDDLKINGTTGIGDWQIQTIGDLISVLLKNIYVLAGIALFILLIFGGIGIIMGAGSGDAKKTGQGQKAVTSALFGFVIIFTSYWIIKIIEIITGINILSSGI